MKACQAIRVHSFGGILHLPPKHQDTVPLGVSWMARLNLKGRPPARPPLCRTPSAPASLRCWSSLSAARTACSGARPTLPRWPALLCSLGVQIASRVVRMQHLSMQGRVLCCRPLERAVIHHRCFSNRSTANCSPPAPGAFPLAAPGEGQLWAGRGGRAAGERGGEGRAARALLLPRGAP